jgi:hypothetical protein
VSGEDCEHVRGAGCAWFADGSNPHDTCDSAGSWDEETADTGGPHVEGRGLCAAIGGEPGVIGLLLVWVALRRRDAR